MSQKKFQKNVFKRKSTSYFQKDGNVETSKMTNYLINKINSDNNEKNKITNIIEEENEVNNNSINSNNEKSNNNKSNNNNNKHVNFEVQENKKKEETINEKRINSPKIEIKTNNNLNKDEPVVKKEDDIKIKDKDKDKEKYVDKNEEKKVDKINLNKTNNITKIINNNDDVKKSNNDNNNNNINKKNINKNEIIENKKEVAINTIKSSFKNNNNNYNTTKDQKDKIREIKPYISNESKYKNNRARSNKGIVLKEDLGKIELSSQPNTHRKISKVNFNKSQESFLAQSERVNTKNKISEDNKIIETNHNTKSKNDNKIFTPTVKKLYNTYSNFPKINRENNILTKTIKSEQKLFDKKVKPNSYSNYRKKILLMKPDDIPVNFFEKTLEEMFKNNLHINVNKSVKINNHKNRDIYNGIKKLLKKG